jgi:hypothetical protein
VSNTKTVAATSFTINEIVSSYLKQKCTCKDDSKEQNRKGLYAILNSTDTKSLDAKLKEYVAIADDARSMQNILVTIRVKLSIKETC